MTLRGLLLLLVAAALGAAQAQSAGHDVRVRVPNYIGLKIVDDAGNIGLGAAVRFDFESDPDAYLDAILGDGEVRPTEVASFADVQVAVRGGSWRVWVRAQPLAYDGPGSGAGLRIADLVVRRGMASGLTPDAITIRPGGSILGTWSLTTSWQRIVNDNQSTHGWRSLGFNGLDYVLLVQGDEDPGRYATVVTYLLTNP